MYVKLKKSTKRFLEKLLMILYLQLKWQLACWNIRNPTTSRAGAPIASLRCWFNGKRIYYGETPMRLGMKDCNEIEIYKDQTGKGENCDETEYIKLN